MGSAWGYLAIGAIFGVGLFCLLLFWAAARFAAQQEARMPVDDMVDLVAEHKPDCACDEQCWPAFKQRMRDIAARQAAELNQEKQR